MSLELEDWIDFNKGIKEFDKSHFYTLLMDNDDGISITEDEINLVFSFFPNSHELSNRLKSYYSNVDFRKSIHDLPKYLIQATTEDVKSKLKLFISDELKPFLENEIHFVESIEEITSSKLEDWQNEHYIDIISDHVYDCRISGEKIIALFEAFFGLTRDYQLTWYLGSPLIKSEINFDNYYDIWKVGGDYAITNDRVIVSRYV